MIRSMLGTVLLFILPLMQQTLVTGALAQENIIYPPDPPATYRTYFGIEYTLNGETVIDEITIDLFGTVVPKTVSNFIHITNGVKAKVADTENVLDAGYAGKPFDKIIDDFSIEGGSVLEKIGRFSIYGNTFADENFELKCDRPGRVAMAITEPDSNNSRFFIVTNKLPTEDMYVTIYDGDKKTQSVVFGQVTNGLDALINAIQKVETDDKHAPVSPVIMKYAMLDEVVRTDPQVAHDLYKEKLERFNNGEKEVGVRYSSLFFGEFKKQASKSDSNQKSSLYDRIVSSYTSLSVVSQRLIWLATVVVLFVLYRKRRYLMQRQSILRPSAKVVSVRPE